MNLATKHANEMIGTLEADFSYQYSVRDIKNVLMDLLAHSESYSKNEQKFLDTFAELNQLKAKADMFDEAVSWINTEVKWLTHINKSYKTPNSVQFGYDQAIKSGSALLLKVLQQLTEVK